jgi:hypothetical protein
MNLTKILKYEDNNIPTPADERLFKLVIINNGIRRESTGG